MNLHQLFWKLTKKKKYPSWGQFWRTSKNIYNLLSIMLLITPWTPMLMLHIRQSIYLVLTNVLSTSTSDVPYYIWWNQHNTVCTILVKVDVLDTCGAMISLYFGIAFLLFFMKIKSTVYTSFQNSTLLFINGFIFDIMNIQNNQSLEFE